MFSCVSSAPFGWPVVPDVYRITAVSLGRRRRESKIDGWPCINCPSVIADDTGGGAATSVVMMTRRGQPDSSHAARAMRAIGSSTVPSKASKATASLSFKWYAISRGLSCTFSGTATAPALRMPKYATGNQGTFGHDRATCSPGAIPSDMSPPATCAARAFSSPNVRCSPANVVATRSGVKLAWCSSTLDRFNALA